MQRAHLRWSYPILGFVVCGLVFLSISRLVLTLWQIDRVNEVDGLWIVLLQGVRFDLVLLAQLVVIPALLVPFLSIFKNGFKFVIPVQHYYLLILAGFLIYVEFITPNFIGQYDFRPNILMIEYLAYPKEVMSMLLKAVPLQLFLATAGTAILVCFFSKFLTFLESKTLCSVAWCAPIVAILGVLICIGAARSTIGHRPVNPSTVAFSSDPLVNSLPLSSGYSVLYALYEKIRHEQSGKPLYGEMAKDVVLEEVYRGMSLSSDMFFDAAIPTLHKQQNGLMSGTTKQKNLVIILQESLGADFVGKLGGQNLTPNIDKLADEGIWFENLYATGTRSVRGIEAVITGFLPTPARSVVKLGGSQNNFFTIAQLLSEHDYDTFFIYGGEAHFDNMKRFFSNNGFNNIIEQDDYVDPLFTGSWGVSDEDLLQKAHNSFSASSTSQHSFFSLVFTSTNHSPFEFPDNRIELVEQPKNTVANAVKYADFALGQFIKQAKQSDYWDNTVFLIIADHSDRVYGNELVPISKFRIPGLVLGGGIQPQVITQVASQIDMLPTMLSLMQIQTSHPAIGRDLTRTEFANSAGRAMMQFDKNYAYMEGENVIVLQKDREALQFNYQAKKLVASQLDLELKNRALVYAQWPVYAYQNKNYKLP